MPGCRGPSQADINQQSSQLHQYATNTITTSVKQASGSFYKICEQHSINQSPLIPTQLYMPITSFPSTTTTIKPTEMNSNSGNSSDNGGLSIGKAEKPTSSSTPSGSRSSLERRGLGQMLNGILHGRRRDEAHVGADGSSETASLSSVATEKRALLGGKKATSPSKSSSRKTEPRLPNINESVVPRGGLR